MSAIIKLFVGVAFVFFLMSLIYNVASSHDAEDYQRLTTDVGSLKESNVTLREENRRLQAYIEGLESDGRLIEQRVREDLGMVRPDEVLILLNQPERASR